MSTTNELTKTYSGVFGNQVILKSRKGKSTITIPPVQIVGPTGALIEKGVCVYILPEFMQVTVPCNAF